MKSETVFINETLARGLRKALFDLSAASMDKGLGRLGKWASTHTMNRTAKAWRRAYAEIDSAFGKVALMQTPPGSKMAGWVVAEGAAKFGERPKNCAALRHVDAAMTFNSMVIDFFTMETLMLTEPVVVKSHAVDRLYQRLGTMNPARVLAELTQAPMLTTICLMETFVCCVEKRLDSPEKSRPIALATTNGMLLGDIVPACRDHEAFITINTFLGGERPITGPRAHLRKRLMAWQEKHGSVLRRGALSLPLVNHSKIHMTTSFPDIIEAFDQYQELLDDFAGVVRQRDDRHAAMMRREMTWNWARAQSTGDLPLLQVEAMAA